MGMIREKLGKKKKVRLPASLAQPAEIRGRRGSAVPEPYQEQMRMEGLDLPEAEEAPAAEDPFPAETGGEGPDA